MTKIDGYELKPCPFCGYDSLSMENNVWHPFIAVVCMNPDCLVSGPLDLGQSGAIERWNTRVCAAEER